MRAYRVCGQGSSTLSHLKNGVRIAKMPLLIVQHMCLVQNFYVFWAILPYKTLDVLF
jgi:hypothetical protein